VKNTSFDVHSRVNFCGDEFNLCLVIFALMPIKPATDMLCHKEINNLNADAAITFTMESFHNENSEIDRALPTALNLSISHKHTNLSQVLQYLQRGTRDDSKIVSSLSKDTVVKITLCLIKCLSPSEKNEKNAMIDDQHGTGCQRSSNSFYNKKFPNSNEVKSLNVKLKLASNDRLLTVSAKNISETRK
jgi:hypothetical protein